MSSPQPSPIPPAGPPGQRHATTTMNPQQALELQIKAAERVHDDETAFARTANDAAIKSGEEAIKAAMLINGGSSVAMLAFVGTLASRNALSSAQLTEIIRPLLWFGTGVAASVVAAAAAYFTNLLIADASGHRAREYVPPYVRSTKGSRRRVTIAEAFRAIGVLAVAVSIGSFIYGLVVSKDAFRNMSGLRDSFHTHDAQ